MEHCTNIKNKVHSKYNPKCVVKLPMQLKHNPHMQLETYVQIQLISLSVDFVFANLPSH